MGFCRQECRSGKLFPSPGDLPSLRVEPRSPALQILYWLSQQGSPKSAEILQLANMRSAYSCLTCPSCKNRNQVSGTGLVFLFLLPPYQKLLPVFPHMALPVVAPPLGKCEQQTFFFFLIKKNFFCCTGSSLLFLGFF